MQVQAYWKGWEDETGHSRDHSRLVIHRQKCPVRRSLET